jgi:transposase
MATRSWISDKQVRRFAIRYEKTLRNYTAVVAIGCALLWLRV